QRSAFTAEHVLQDYSRTRIEKRKGCARGAFLSFLPIHGEGIQKGFFMKKLINRPEDVVKEALAGMQAAHSDLIRVDIEQRIIVRKDAPIQGKVGVISGGGSGHEPMHGGFVGYGMLDAACPGEVFTSPVPDQMLAATKAVNGGAGVLHVVKNYTGDVLNFEMAA